MRNQKQLIAVGGSVIVCVLLTLFVAWPKQPQVTGLIMVDNMALPGATILFYPATEAGDVVGDPGFAMTDDAGVYTVFEPLKPGTYSVVVRPSAIEVRSPGLNFSEIDAVQRGAMMTGDSAKLPPTQFLVGFIEVSGSQAIDGDFMIQSAAVAAAEKLAAVPRELR